MAGAKHGGSSPHSGIRRDRDGVGGYHDACDKAVSKFAGRSRRSELVHTPVVIILDDTECAFLTQAYESGACDYIMKPVDPASSLHGAVLRSKEEVYRRMARERELMAATRQLQVANQELPRLSVVDAVTGIANRRSFDQTLDRV